jgi:hypothetical protein
MLIALTHMFLLFFLVRFRQDCTKLGLEAGVDANRSRQINFGHFFFELYPLS